MKYLVILLLLITVPALSQDDTTNRNQSGLSDSLLLEGVDAKFVLDKYIEAIGGRENLFNVVDRTTQMTGTVTGFDVKMTIYQKKPNMLRQEIKASGLDQVIIFDGEKAVMKLGEEKQNILGDDLKRLSYEASMGLILNPDSAGVKYELAGIRMVGDKKTYKIDNRAGDVYWSSYYSMDNGLKLLEEKQVNTSSGAFLQEIYFNNYKEVEEVRYPFRIEQKLGPQELEFTVTSIKVNQDLDDSLFETD